MHFKSTTIFALIFALSYGQDAEAHRHLRRVMKPDETLGFLSLEEKVMKNEVSEIIDHNSYFFYYEFLMK